MLFIMKTFQNSLIQNKVLSSNQRLRRKLDLQSKNGTDCLQIWHLADVETSRAFRGSPTAATACGRQQGWVPQQSPPLLRGLKGLAAYQVQVSENLVRTVSHAFFCRNYVAILWLSGEIFTHKFCQPFHFCLSRLDMDKRTPLEMYLKTESYDKEGKKKKKVFQWDKLRKPETLPFHLEVPLGQVVQVNLGFPRGKSNDKLYPR